MGDSVAKDILRENIIQYYEQKCIDYLQGVNRKTLAIHAGFTDENVTGFEESLIYMNQVLADMVGIKNNHIVLDAGCGVGGSSIWLAKQRGAKVIGISIVERQTAYASMFAKNDASLNDKVEFAVSDFLQTGFNGESFDCVWALESVCYAPQKMDFISEAYRLLKPGGTLLVADGFQSHIKLTKDEEMLLNSWLSSWVVPNLATVEEFFSYLHGIKFYDIEYQNISKNVLPFSLNLYYTALHAKLEEKGMDDPTQLSTEDLYQIRGARDQMRSLISGIWEYGIFRAKKPIEI